MVERTASSANRNECKQIAKPDNYDNLFKQLIENRVKVLTLIKLELLYIVNESRNKRILIYFKYWDIMQ